MNPRKEILNELIKYAKEDSRIHILMCDMGFGVQDNFKKELPDRIINIGIMEQGTVGIAAGMAMSGLIPVVYSICNFLCYRALEQIRNDVVLQDLNVKFIGTGANNYFTFLGQSHCCSKEDKKIMDIIGLSTYDPYVYPDNYFEHLVRQWIKSTRAGYMRV